MESLSREMMSLALLLFRHSGWHLTQNHQASSEARIKTDIIGATVREMVSHLDSCLFHLSLKVIQITVFIVVRDLQ